jgi:hypothetical protein
MLIGKQCLGARTRQQKEKADLGPWIFVMSAEETLLSLN